MSKRSCVAAESIEDAFCEWARAELLPFLYKFIRRIRLTEETRSVFEVGSEQLPIILNKEEM